MHTESEDIAAALFGSVDKRIVWWKVGGFWFNWNFGDTDGWDHRIKRYYIFLICYYLLLTKYSYIHFYAELIFCYRLYINPKFFTDIIAINANCLRCVLLFMASDYGCKIVHQFINSAAPLNIFITFCVRAHSSIYIYCWMCLCIRILYAVQRIKCFCENTRVCFEVRMIIIIIHHHHRLQKKNPSASDWARHQWFYILSTIKDRASRWSISWVCKYVYVEQNAMLNAFIASQRAIRLLFGDVGQAAHALSQRCPHKTTLNEGRNYAHFVGRQTTHTQHRVWNGTILV